MESSGDAADGTPGSAASKIRMWAHAPRSHFGPGVALSMIKGEVIEILGLSEKCTSTNGVFRPSTDGVFRMKNSRGNVGDVGLSAVQSWAWKARTSIDFGLNLDAAHNTERLRDAQKDLIMNLSWWYICLNDENRRYFEHEVKPVVCGQRPVHAFCKHLRFSEVSTERLERALANYWQEWNDTTPPAPAPVSSATADTATQPLPMNEPAPDEQSPPDAPNVALFKQILDDALFKQILQESWDCDEFQKTLDGYARAAAPILQQKTLGGYACAAAPIQFYSTIELIKSQDFINMQVLLARIIRANLETIESKTESLLSICENMRKSAKKSEMFLRCCPVFKTSALPVDVLQALVYGGIVRVPNKEVTPPESSAGPANEGSAPAKGSKPKIDINTCTYNALRCVLSTTLAKRVFEIRKKPFTSFSDLRKRVEGIGEQKLALLIESGYTVVAVETPSIKQETDDEPPAKRQALCCPITSEPFKAPVVVSCCGESYEKWAIERWIRENPHDTKCPTCKAPINKRMLTPNIRLQPHNWA